MKIIIEEPHENEEDSVTIRCRNISSDVLSLISRLKQGEQLVGYDSDKIYRVSPNDIYYFEAVDNKVFIYCKERFFESKSKLYELEHSLSGTDFFRASKSTIVNLAKIKSLAPALSGRFEATLDNHEKLIISRQYVPELKKKLGV